jgi:hypothetical protein
VKLLPHPIAECFPLLPLVELQAMSLDIAKNGLIHPIVIFENKILEGRNRDRACEMAGVKPTYEQYTGSDPRGYVISVNAMRLTSRKVNGLASPRNWPPLQKAIQTATRRIRLVTN